ncbi:MAG: hypothetical protein Q8P67_15565 [archaeon]|nr:hypothetical protein [archaeon]
MASANQIFPKLVVLDLDMCVWSPETYLLEREPRKGDCERGSLGAGVGVVGVRCGRQVLRVFEGALQFLQHFWEGRLGEGSSEMRLACASSADTPKAVACARAAIELLEVLPGVPMRRVLAKGWPEGFDGNLQIGRTHPLSPNKGKTHFPILRRETGVEYHHMLFFDDCNWDDNCATVRQHCPGVVTQKTPTGMRFHEWLNGLEKYQIAFDSSKSKMSF